MLEPATGVEVAVELVDLFHGLVGVVHQAHQFHVGGQDVAVFLQLLADEVQGALPELASRDIQQNHRHQRALACLHQRQDFQCFIKRAETARAEHQGIGLLDEEQFAGEEEVERQQVRRAFNGRICMLLERQGDIESQAVFAPCAFMGGGHDATAGAGDDHHVRTGQCSPQFSGQAIQRMFDGRSGRAEDRDLAPALELFEGTEGVFQFPQGL
ncbi:hypothetical protein SRABI06_05382 [Pseudomonas brassicacearum]|nr:hypothetical protein SRABI06_05382 [Pseudomonas brassicacearum]